MRDVFVVTHAEALHHLTHQVGGWSDTELTENGLRQARQIADRLGRLAAGREVALFTSDLRRATRTAEAIARRLGVAPVPMPGLRETRYGVAEGKPRTWLDSQRTSVPPEERLDHRIVEGAETRREIATRIYGAMDEILRNPRETLVVVTHGFALTFVVSAWIGMPIEALATVSFPAVTGGITHLQEDDFWGSRAVVSLAATDHLQA